MWGGMEVKKRGWVIAISLLLLIGLVFGAREMWAEKNEQALSKKEAVEAVQEKYSANVKKISLRDDAYDVRLENKFGIYNLQLDKNTGDIQRLYPIQMFSSDEKEKKESSHKGSTQPKINERQAKQKALERMNGKGEVTNIELNTEEGRPVYTVTTQNAKRQAEMAIDGNSGDILFYSTQEDDRESEKSSKEQKSSKIKVTPEKAKQIALSKVNGSIDEIELESEDGSYVYEIEIETEDDEATVIIQAYTGEVLSVTFEHDDDDDDNDDNED